MPLGEWSVPPVKSGEASSAPKKTQLVPDFASHTWRESVYTSEGGTCHHTCKFTHLDCSHEDGSDDCRFCNVPIVHMLDRIASAMEDRFPVLNHE